MGIESADKGGALDVLGAVRDLCLETFYCLATSTNLVTCSKLFQLMVALGKKRRICIDSS